MKFAERIQKLIEQGQAEVVELEAEWERLDSMGTMIEKQQEIAEQIRKITGEIEGFQKLLQHLGKGKK